mmetsp:Transcript_35961/g.101213  ORF Transcript_35961/g.101213 Transcript_35961/m.101213 type:complete len:399 (-) Transcript_35961:5609-6805(-)
MGGVDESHMYVVLLHGDTLPGGLHRQQARRRRADLLRRCVQLLEGHGLEVVLLQLEVGGARQLPRGVHQGHDAVGEFVGVLGDGLLRLRAAARVLTNRVQQPEAHLGHIADGHLQARRHLRVGREARAAAPVLEEVHVRIRDIRHGLHHHLRGARDARYDLGRRLGQQARRDDNVLRSCLLVPAEGSLGELPVGLRNARLGRVHPLDLLHNVDCGLPRNVQKLRRRLVRRVVGCSEVLLRLGVVGAVAHLPRRQHHLQAGNGKRLRAVQHGLLREVIRQQTGMLLRDGADGLHAPAHLGRRVHDEGDAAIGRSNQLHASHANGLVAVRQLLVVVRQSLALLHRDVELGRRGEKPGALQARRARPDLLHHLVHCLLRPVALLHRFLQNHDQGCHLVERL